MSDYVDEIIFHLHQADGHVSGEHLSESLGISRSAVWKHIESLRQKGYEIQARPRLGYKLIRTPKKMTAEEIKARLHTDLIGQELIVKSEVSSTNEMAKRWAMDDAPDGSVVISERQSAGRGRRGRSWDSEAGGLYMSICLRPDIPPQEVALLTLMGAAAVRKALDEHFDIRAFVKWPNDVVSRKNKKMCGILTELSTDTESVNFLIMGIGLNVNQTESYFSEEVRDQATSIKLQTGDDISLTETALAVIQEIDDMYSRARQGEFVEVLRQCRKYSSVIGNDIRVMTTRESYNATAEDISDRGTLIIRRNDGQPKELFSGDISIRNR